MTGSKIVKVVGWVFLGIAIAATLGLVLGFGLMLLWNWLMPDLLGLPEITYWQAVGLFVLCHLLFKATITTATRTREGPPWKRKGSCNPFAEKIHGLVEKKSKDDCGCDETDSQEPTSTQTV